MCPFKSFTIKSEVLTAYRLLYLMMQQLFMGAGKQLLLCFLNASFALELLVLRIIYLCMVYIH